MSCIVIVDMRESNGQVVAIGDGQSLAQFASRAEAESFMSEHILGQFRRSIIDLDMGDAWQELQGQEKEAPETSNDVYLDSLDPYLFTEYPEDA